MKTTKQHTYFVHGMHCASCEILIEKKLLELSNVQAVEASLAKNQVTIGYIGSPPTPEKLNELFEKEKYIFSESELPKNNSPLLKGLVSSVLIAGAIIAGFLLLNKFGLAKLVNVNSASSLPTFFAFGLLAGLSSCAALVGGLILSMSKQWNELYSKKDLLSARFEPHLLFNLGRLVSYVILGGLLGLIGQKLQLSITFTSLLVLAISVVMIFLALQMLGFGAFRRWQFTAPKSITKYIADPKNFSSRWMPGLLGALTFFLPCGFTITAQGLALLSGNFFQGAMIMLTFALGTLPSLLAIGFASAKFSSNHYLSTQFLKVAGILVLFFAVFNINNQLNVLGVTAFNGLNFSSAQNQNNNLNQEKDLPPIVNGQQILKMNASSAGYSPKYLKVRVGVPVRWEITDIGTSGCTNAIISRSLFDGQIDLTPGQTSIKEFTPQKVGQYRFSCWMGMVTGIIEVVDPGAASLPSDASPAASLNDNSVFPSGAQGCGCGKEN